MFPGTSSGARSSRSRRTELADGHPRRSPTTIRGRIDPASPAEIAPVVQKEPRHRDVARILADGGRLGLGDVTVAGEPPELPAPVDRLVCLDGRHGPRQIRRAVEHAGFEVRETERRDEDLLEVRDRIREAIDYERLTEAPGERGEDLRDGMRVLEAAVESGRVGYVSIVATKTP